MSPRNGDGDIRMKRRAFITLQQPIKFELVVNLKTAKALGVEVPARLLFTADEVIE
jgi:ABC-type uncharacterized transport system substrate-binding protein